MVKVPQVVGMKLENARPLLLSLGVQVGNIAYEVNADQVPGTILRQRPDQGQHVHIGENIDLWLVAFQEKSTAIPDAPILPKN